jgi:predicted lactoylglutathione lyase
MAAIKPTEAERLRVATAEIEKSDDSGVTQLEPATGEGRVYASTFQDGDGQLLAEYEGRGLYFDAKLKG